MNRLQDILVDIQKNVEESYAIMNEEESCPFYGDLTRVTQNNLDIIDQITEIFALMEMGVIVQGDVEPLPPPQQPPYIPEELWDAPPKRAQGW